MCEINMTVFKSITIFLNKNFRFNSKIKSPVSLSNCQVIRLNMKLKKQNFKLYNFCTVFVTTEAEMKKNNYICGTDFKMTHIQYCVSVNHLLIFMHFD